MVAYRKRKKRVVKSAKETDWSTLNPIQKLKFYAESVEFRSALRKICGTKSQAFKLVGGGVHWVSKWPEEKHWWDSIKNGVQNFNFASSDNFDTYCSLYSMYHEIQYKYPELSALYTKEYEPNDVKRMRLNKAILKTGLRKIASLPKWPRNPLWDNWPVERQKQDFLEAVSKF